MESFYRIKSFNEEGEPIRGYRQRIFSEWRDGELFEWIEQHVCDQARELGKMDSYHNLNWKQLKDQ